MKLYPQHVEKITYQTLEYYNQYAKEFWVGTRDHDVDSEHRCAVTTHRG